MELMRPLTDELMNARRAHLRAQCEAAIAEDPDIDGIEGMALDQITCDRCGFVFDMLALGVNPVGWWVSGSMATGFVDHCRACGPGGGLTV